MSEPLCISTIYKFDHWHFPLFYYNNRYKDELREEATKTGELMDIIQQDPSIYFAEAEHTQLSQIADLSNVHYKSGYLNMKSRIPIISKWDRYFFFTQNGSLMHQLKTEIAGYPLIDLKSDIVVLPLEFDDRRYVFQINCLSPKRTIILQANSERDREEVRFDNISFFSGNLILKNKIFSGLKY